MGIQTPGGRGEVRCGGGERVTAHTLITAQKNLKGDHFRKIII